MELGLDAGERRELGIPLRKESREVLAIVKIVGGEGRMGCHKGHSGLELIGYAAQDRQDLGHVIGTGASGSGADQVSGLSARTVGEGVGARIETASRIEKRFQLGALGAAAIGLQADREGRTGFVERDHAPIAGPEPAAVGRAEAAAKEGAVFAQNHCELLKVVPSKAGIQKVEPTLVQDRSPAVKRHRLNRDIPRRDRGEHRAAHGPGHLHRANSRRIRELQLDVQRPGRVGPIEDRSPVGSSQDVADQSAVQTLMELYHECPFGPREVQTSDPNARDVARCRAGSLPGADVPGLEAVSKDHRRTNGERQRRHPGRSEQEKRHPEGSPESRTESKGATRIWCHWVRSNHPVANHTDVLLDSKSSAKNHRDPPFEGRSG